MPLDNPAYQRLSDQQFSSLNSLCDQFEEKLQQGTNPSLEDFMTNVPKSERNRAFAELLAIEIDYRSIDGQCPIPADYETRFAKDRTTIVSVFREAEALDDSCDSTPNSVTASAIPSEIGDFRIMSEIGRGGMGAVYKARQPRLDRLVAIKVLLPIVATNPALKERFLQEGRALARLQHANIVSVFAAEELDEAPFLVMEFVEGQSLADIVRADGPLDVAQAVNLTIQAARGFEYAHRKGVIHRDIKPSNLLLDNEGTLKVLDLGLARLAADDQLGGGSSITKTGDVMGTVDFMAPEQAADIRSATARSDVYSLGCTLFYLLTGRVLHERDTVVKAILAHREESPPSLCGFRPEVSPVLESAWRRMVACDQGKRTQSMSAVIAELSNSADPRIQLATTQPRTGRMVMLLAIVTMVILGVWLSGVVPFLLHNSGASPVAKSDHVRPADENAGINFSNGPNESRSVPEYEFRVGEQQLIGEHGRFPTVSTGDVDGDGDIDAVTGEASRLVLWRNVGGGRFKDRVIESHECRWVKLVDLTNDGVADLVYTSPDANSSVLINNGSGSFAPSATAVAAPRAENFTVGDIDGINGPDVLLFDQLSQDVDVWLNQGNAKFKKRVDRLPISGVGRMECGDLNGDKSLDLVIINWGEPLTVLFNDGTGHFVQSAQQFPSSTAVSLMLADFDSDGDLDAHVTNEGESDCLWKNDGVGGFTATYPKDSTFLNLASAETDFRIGGTVRMIVKPTATSKRPQIHQRIDDQWRDCRLVGFNRDEFDLNAVAIADFNNDGSPDVFACNRNSMPHRILFSQPSGSTPNFPVEQE